MQDKLENDNLSLKHLAVVMDGNGRWAQERGLPRNLGHEQGVESLKNLVRNCTEMGIGFLTVFAFSSENWARSKSEINFLMTLFVRTINNELTKLDNQGVRLTFVGDKYGLPKSLINTMNVSEAKTRSNKGLKLNICFNYGGKWDIVQGIKNLIKNDPDLLENYTSLTEEIFSKYLSLSESPSPDLFIRTGGEKRLSNFLLWDLAYTELYFTDTFWPDFNENHLKMAVDFYYSRKRKFGGTSETNNLIETPEEKRQVVKCGN